MYLSALCNTAELDFQRWPLMHPGSGCAGVHNIAVISQFHCGLRRCPLRTGDHSTAIGRSVTSAAGSATSRDRRPRFRASKCWSADLPAAAIYLQLATCS